MACNCGNCLKKLEMLGIYILFTPKSGLWMHLPGSCLYGYSLIWGVPRHLISEIPFFAFSKLFGRNVCNISSYVQALIEY